MIEQAKGMLMAIYGIDAAAAFDLLKWRSQETNVKLRSLAEQIVARIRHYFMARDFTAQDLTDQDLTAQGPECARQPKTEVRRAIA